MLSTLAAAAPWLLPQASTIQHQPDRETCSGGQRRRVQLFRSEPRGQPTGGRSRYPVRLWMCLHALVAAAWCLGLTAAAAELHCSVASLPEFVQALSSSSCSVLQIEGDGLALSQAAWIEATRSNSQHRLLVSRDVTLRGSRRDTRFNCGYLKSRIAIGANVTLTVSHLLLLDCQQPSAPLAGGFDVLALGRVSQLVIVNATVQQPVCGPLDLMLDITTDTPRPPAVPGTQAVRRVSEVCLSPERSYSTSCWPGALLLKDFAQNGTAIQPDGSRAVAGVVRYINTSLVCAREVSADCPGPTADLSACVAAVAAAANLSVWDTYDLPGSEGVKALRTDQTDAKVLLAFVVPTVFVGTALVLAIIGLLVWSRQRKKFSPCPEAVKEAYEGVVFVGLAEGSDEPSQPPTVGDGAAIIGGQPKGKGAASGRGALQPFGEPWTDTRGSAPSSDGHDHDQHPSFVQPHLQTPHHRGGAASRSLTASNCTSNNSAPPIVGITMASASNSGSPGALSLPEPALTLPPVVTGIAHLTARGVLTTATLAVDLSPEAKVVGDGSPAAGGRCGKGASASPRTAAVLAAAAPSTSSRDGAIVHSLFDSGPLNNVVPPLNLVLGIDVVVSGPQSVPSRSSFGTAMRARYGNQQVAVRVFHRDSLGGSFEALKALKQDIEALSRHQHPNIVAVLGAGEAQGGDEVFMLEEPMISSVGRICHEGQGLPLDRVLSIALDVALGLSYLHPTVMHGNLRPSNVLLDSSRTAKLTGFGLRRSPEATGPELGAAPYLAPECFSKARRGGTVTTKFPVTPQSDMYSFGVLLWEMLSRDRPWRGFNVVQIALEHSYGRQLEMPSSGRFTPQVRRLILQCWEQDPGKRPTAAEVAKRLSAIIHQQPRPRR